VFDRERIVRDARSLRLGEDHGDVVGVIEFIEREGLFARL